MRILLVAYEFPPSTSPRALRWRYLLRELVLLGHEVHVLIPDLGDPGVEFPAGPGSIVLHRTFPGPYGWVVGRANRRRSQHDRHDKGGPVSASGIGLNWRGRIVESAKTLAGLVLFPDVRAEWAPWARRALRGVLKDLKPDVVITSHEPASTLPLGLYAKRHGFAWVADLGDPVCAPYTPPRWRKRAMKLEARVSAQADCVLVTNEAARALLVDRHGQDPERCLVLSNGYDDRHCENPTDVDDPAFDEDRLELIYAGRLYGYRDPTRLLQAVAKTPGVRLTLVVPDPPTGGEAAIAAAAGDRLRTLGPLPHAQVLRMQQRADVLVNMGNRGLPAQIPAKIYEYLGIARPILHVDTGDTDAAAQWLRELRRGWLCEDEVDRLVDLLHALARRKRDGTLEQGLELTPVPRYAHSARGRRLALLLQEVAGNMRGTVSAGRMPDPSEDEPA